MNSNIVSINRYPFAVNVSTGYEDKAEQAAILTMSAKEKLDHLFGFSPLVSLYVLSKNDWDKYSSIPIYGMPNYSSRMIVIAAEKGDFWQNMTEMIINNRPDNIEPLRSVYADSRGEIDLSSFFLMLVVHELGHAYHSQYSFQFPRLWLMELFANLCNHVCLASCHPESLAALVTFSNFMSQVDPSKFRHKTWKEFEENYSRMDPANYGWYQTRLKVIAAQLYESLGDDVLSRIWSTFAIPDNELCETIERRVSGELCNLLMEL